jgi:Ca-activated chloride channel family protein
MTLINPAALWLLAAVPGLLALYFLKFRRPERRVGSTQFWRTDRADRDANSFFRRWRPTRQLWLQLLALVAAAVALARPALETPRGGGAREILVLDRGVTMQATDVVPTRFDRARADLLARVDGLRAGQEAMVIDAGPRARVATHFTADRVALRRAVATLEPADAAGDLAGALAIAAAHADPLTAADLVVFTDRAWPDLEHAQLASTLRALKGRVRLAVVEPTGAGAGSNVGITAMEVRPRIDQPSAHELFVALANTSEREQTFTLTIAQEGMKLSAERVRLGPKVKRSFVIPVEGRGGSRLEARVDLRDDLAADNVAYAVVPAAIRLDVALVTRGNAFLEKALGAELRFNISVFDPDRYPGPADFDVVVFDGWVPERLATGRYLFVNAAPPAFVQALGTVESPAVVEWDRTHPVMRHVDFSKVLIKEALKVRPLTGARTLAESSLTPLLLAYDAEGVRWVFLGFDVQASDFPLRVGFPLFAANAVRWLRPTLGDSGTAQVRAGEAVALPLPKGAAEVAVTGPHGSRWTAEVVDGVLRLPPTIRAGVYAYQVRGRGADGAPGRWTGEARFAVNLTSDSVTDIEPRGRLPVGTAELDRLGAFETPPGPVRQEVWHWALALALAAALLETWLEWRRAGLRPTWPSMLLRGAAVALLVLAVAGVKAPLPDDRLNVVFLLDESQSVPSVARERAVAFVRDQVAKMRPDDGAGVIGFGGAARVRVAMQARPHLTAWTVGEVEEGATDLEGAIRLGLATLPEGGARRLVLLSDGNETRGRAVEGARLAKEEGADLLVLPLAPPGADEALVESVVVPREVKAGEAFDVKVVVRSREKGRGRLSLYRNGQYLGSRVVPYDAGPTLFAFGQSLEPEGFHVYTARLEPDADQFEENNAAVGVTAVHGRPTVLLVERDLDQAHHLQRALRKQGIDLEVVAPGRLPTIRGGARRYDGIILSNVSSVQLTRDQMEEIRTFVRDDGGGFVMLGGDESFGLGGYYRTPIEDALPVSMDARQKIDMPNLSVVVVIDKSMSMDIRKAGEASKLDMAKMAAQYAVELMDTRDEVGVIVFDEAFEWAVPFRRLGEKDEVLRLIGAIRTGGATEMYAAMREAINTVKGGRGALKHVILLTDGQSTAGDFLGLAREAAAAKVTLSSVAIGKDAAVTLMRDIAFEGNGRFYFVEEPTEVPRIFTRETQLATKTALIEEPFRPVVVNPGHEVTHGIDWSKVPPLGGYVATTAKPTADVPLATPHQDPLLAVWRYGLGRAAAFTSDTKAKWGFFWLSWPEFPKVIGQAVRWTLRTQKPKLLSATVEADGARGVLRIDAVDLAGRFVNFAEIQAGVVSPDKQLTVVGVPQVGPGRYEARFEARQTGAYLIGIDPKVGPAQPAARSQGGAASRRSGAAVGAESQIASLVVPYSRELRDLGANEALLATAARIAGGKVVRDTRDLDVFALNRKPRRQPVDVWWAAASLGLALFMLDVALRRVAAVRRRRRAARA